MKRVIFIVCAGVMTLHADMKSITVGYSESIRFDAPSVWSLQFDASFNEYAVYQDAMEIAFGSDTTSPFYPNSSSAFGAIVVFDNGYKPGFEVGFVLNTPYDGWDFGGDYLWFRSKTSLSKSAEAPIYYMSPIFIEGYFVPLASLQTDWRVGLDRIDLYLARAYYSGKHLSIDPQVGLRGLLLRQHFNISGQDTSSHLQSADIYSTGWGVGPNIGVEGNALFPYGFALFGGCSTSLIYMRYTEISLNYTGSALDPAFATNKNLGTLRPIMDAGIGLRWGTESRCKKYYISLEAAYNFSVYFSQNMMRALVATASSNQAAYGNLYLQGVSVGASFVF